MDAGRMNDLGEQRLAALRSKGRRLAERLWFTDGGQRIAKMERSIMRYARYYFDTAEEIVRLFRWHCRGVGNDRNLRNMLERDLIDPVFPSSSAETKEERERLWQSFLKDIEILDARMLAALEHEYICAASDEEQRSVRGWIHRWIDDNIATIDVARHHAVIRCAYPRIEFREGAYWRESVSGSYDKRVSADEAQEIVRHAANVFVKRLDVGPLAQGDETWTIGSYWPMIWRGDAWTVCQAVRRNSEKFKNVPEKEDTRKFLEKVVRMFPELEDEFGPEATKRERLAVTRLIEWPYVPWERYEHTTRCIKGDDPYWKDGKLWFHAFGNVLMLDSKTGKIERLGTFAVPTSGHSGKDVCAVRATDSYCIFLVRWRGSFLAFRERDNPEWRSVSIDAEIMDVIEVDASVYALISRRDEKWGFQKGLIKIDARSLEVTSILDPLTLETDSRMGKLLGSGSKGPVGDDGAMQYRLAFANGEFVVCSDVVQGPPFYAWNPQTKKWHEVDKSVWTAAREDQDPYETASYKYGFEVVRLEAYKSPPQLLLCRPGIKRRVTHWSEMEKSLAVPLECAQKIEGNHRPPILLEDSVLLTLAEHGVNTETLCVGFHVLPYADIRKWLEENTTFYANTNSPILSAAPKTSSAN